jgi:hypothetical protein
MPPPGPPRCPNRPGFTKQVTRISLNGHQFAVGPDPVEHGGITVTWQGSDNNREWYDL